jgi:putative endopeptidase
VLDCAAHLQYLGAEPLFATYVFQDEKNSEAYALHLYQGGLGLPNRDYYFDDDERTRNIRSEYVKHVARMLELLGDDPAAAAAGAATVMRIETDLAGASRKLAELRDPEKNYNKMTLAEASQLTPSIKWRSYLAVGHIEGVDSAIVGQPEFFRQLEKSLATESVADWKTYLRWSLVHAYAEELSSNFEQENFHFYGTVMNGTPQIRPRWKRMLDEEELYLGDALGQLYVRDYFSPATRARYEKLTDDVFAAFADRIRRLDWMSPETRQAALRKLGTVNKKVGYPDKWKDYSSLDVDRDSFTANCMRGRIWNSEYAIQKLHKPVDRAEWSMTPQTYNAYYDPSKNEIVLPAAIFILPGIADSDIDDALVYAYAGGTTIGHEITHGFDDEGRQFDEKGNLRNWWTASDAAEFNKRAQGIVRQFDSYVVVDGLHVNGAATEGENLADLGGILLGWDAYTKTDEYRSGKSTGGYTPAQRYFVGWALGWMNNVRPEALAVQVKVDVHSPSFLRTNGPVSNMPPFFEAFGVKPGDAMYRAPADIVHVW